MISSPLFLSPKVQKWHSFPVANTCGADWMQELVKEDTIQLIDPKDDKMQDFTNAIKDPFNQLFLLSTRKSYSQTRLAHAAIAFSLASPTLLTNFEKNWEISKEIVEKFANQAFHRQKDKEDMLQTIYFLSYAFSTVLEMTVLIKTIRGKIDKGPFLLSEVTRGIQKHSSIITPEVNPGDERKKQIRLLVMCFVQVTSGEWPDKCAQQDIESFLRT